MTAIVGGLEELAAVVALLTVEEVTHYGQPDDPFVKIVDRVKVDDGNLVVHRQVYARGLIQSVECTIGFAAEGK